MHIELTFVYPLEHRQNKMNKHNHRPIEPNKIDKIIIIIILITCNTLCENINSESMDMIRWQFLRELTLTTRSKIENQIEWNIFVESKK